MAKLLVVDDDRAIAELVRDQLVRGGHEAVLAHDGATARALALEGRTDLLVLDLMLPGESGLDVLRAVRAAPIAQPIVLVLTARVTEEDALLGFEAGADDYVRKPFGVAELGRRIDALLGLRARATAPARTLRFGALVIDRDARSVAVGHRAVHLTPKELDLLVHLAERAGKVLDREQLLADVWGYRHAGYARTVDSHVTRVRRKLAEAELATEVIHTVHGTGYRFEAS
jgi:DNA-binding response OmpR family regulator